MSYAKYTDKELTSALVAGRCRDGIIEEASRRFCKTVAQREELEERLDKLERATDAFDDLELDIDYYNDRLVLDVIGRVQWQVQVFRNTFDER